MTFLGEHEEPSQIILPTVVYALTCSEETIYQHATGRPTLIMRGTQCLPTIGGLRERDVTLWGDEEGVQMSWKKASINEAQLGLHTVTVENCPWLLYLSVVNDCNMKRGGLWQFRGSRWSSRDKKTKRNRRKKHESRILRCSLRKSDVVWVKRWHCHLPKVTLGARSLSACSPPPDEPGFRAQPFILLFSLFIKLLHCGRLVVINLLSSH